MAYADQKIHENTAISQLTDGSSSYVAGDQLDWTEAKPGVHVRWLYRSPGDDKRTGVVRLEAGARTAPHEHPDLEQIYVLSGAFHDGKRLLSTGDHCVRPPGAVHSAFSEHGAVVLVIYTPV